MAAPRRPRGRLTAGDRVPSVRRSLSPGRQSVLFLLFVAGYFLLGAAGLQLQSVQTGVTPVWPASGFALAMVYWFGLGQVLAILPAMLALGWMLGVPLEIAALSAAGSMLEAVVPVYLLRRLGTDPGLRYVRDALLFIVIGPVLGPLFSATTGSIAFQLLSEGPLDLWRLWLLWWLGNSLGILLFGGFGLVAVARRSPAIYGKRLIELLLAGGAVVLITVLSLLQVVNIASPLLFYLLIPVFVMMARRGDQFPVLLLGVIAVIVMLASAAWLPPESLQQSDIGILYLDLSLLWVVTFTGMMVSSARQELQAREQVSWLIDHDPLTRLLNRRAFMERLESALSRRPPARPSHILFYLDLDRFKDLNDAEGYRTGDRVLRDIGALVAEELRPADALARLDGDAFGVLLENCNLLDACALAENVRSLIERYEYEGQRGIRRVEASIGLLELRPGHLSPEDALYEVETACYAAKRAGRNRVWVYSEAASANGE